jgi:flavodoxin
MKINAFMSVASLFLLAGICDAGENQAGKNKILVAYFSWSGNTRGLANQIHQQLGGDIFEITLVKPYSADYRTCLDEAKRDQAQGARPRIEKHVADINQYDAIFIGYPNWWASIPMPIASFLEEYDLSGKTIVPFSSHGGGGFGQSLSAIAKLSPRARILEGFSANYGGGSSLRDDISAWLGRIGMTGNK